MARQKNKALVLRLQHAVAGGSTPTKWAKANDVLPRTARNWANTPEFAKAVADIHRAVTNRVIAKLTRYSLSAANQIARLAKSGENDHIKLAAAKSIISSLIDITSFANSERQFDELRLQVMALEAAVAERSKIDANDQSD
jgi:hypothetical protein